MDYNDYRLSARQAADFLGVTTAALSYQRKAGCGPTFETVTEPGTTRTRYFYRLGSLLEFMAARGATKTEVEAARRKMITQHRLRLARAADHERIRAMSAIRQARRAREAAALAGHQPSIRIFETGDF